MPPTLTYPGVYIEELPSAVHTITGVATSIAAFVGWADQGPTDQAVLVESWSDFERQFGGLTTNQSTGNPNYLGYSVNQFFANGGQQAYIVRLVGQDALKGLANVPADSGAFTVVPLAAVKNPTTYGIQISPGSVAGKFNFTLYQVSGGTQTKIGSTLADQTAATIKASVSGDATLSTYVQIQNVGVGTVPVSGSSANAFYMLAPVNVAGQAHVQVSIPATQVRAFTVQAVAALQSPNSYGVQIVSTANNEFSFSLYQVSGGQQNQIGTTLTAQDLRSE